MTSENVYIWVHLPDASEPIIAGRLEVTTGAAGSIGRFNYGQSYLNNPRAVPIDPVALPLRQGIQTFTSLNGYPGAILDAGPDAWGKRVIDRLYGKQNHPLGYLLLNDAGRSGCLSFSTKVDEPPASPHCHAFDLANLMSAAVAVETNQPVDQALLKALSPSSGGARPKCTMVENGVTWIAKFPSVDDRYISVPRLEHATMRLAQSCGINTAETRLCEINGNDVCLVRRFDRVELEGNITRRGFLSARTVFYDDPGFAAVATGSYQRLSRWMPRFGATLEDQKQLYRRLVFNVVVRNDDDHELNHGLIHQRNDQFVLAPAYDLVPNLQTRPTNYHALLIGASGAGTVANLMDVAEDFALSKEQALSIVRDIEALVLNTWQDIFYEAGFGDEDIRKVESVFRPIPISQD